MIRVVGKGHFVNFAALLFLIVCLSVLSVYVQSDALLSYIFIMLSIFIIGCFLLHKQKMDLFEPLPWFLLMSSLFYVFSILICVLGFDFLYHDNFSGREDRYDIFRYAIAVFTVGVLCFMIGDSIAGSFSFSFEKAELPRCFSQKVLLFVGAGLVVIGIINFFINSYAYGGSDFFLLLKDFGARDHRIQSGVFYSTLGYNFLIAGLFFLMLRRVLYFKNLGCLYKVMFVGCLVILLSTGRIWYSVSLVFVFMGFAHLSGVKIELRSMLFYCMVICFAVLLIYFVRLYSNLIYIDADGAFGDGSVGDLFARVVEFIFGRSNVPSVPILMEVVDYYSHTHDFLVGKTFFYWLTYFVPGYDVTFLGHEIKDKFYPGRPGGFPPTVFGEFFANGGIFFLIIASLNLGFLMRLFYIYVKQRGSFLLYFAYAAVLFRFIFMLPKLEMSSFGSAVWLFLPTAMIFMVLRLFAFKGRA